jgi:hypothetical protein
VDEQRSRFRIISEVPLYRTARHTALFIALILKRSQKTRIRFGESTMRKLAERKKLRGAFVLEAQLAAMDVGVILVELNRGGFGAMWAAALDGAASVTAKSLVPLAERKKLTEEKLLAELDLPAPAEEEDED